MSSELGNVIVTVDGSEESMHALRWALENLKLRSTPPGTFTILHVQSPPSITTGLNPGAIPSAVPVPAFTAAIEAHQRRITEAVLCHALEICREKNMNVKTHVVVGDPKDKICEVVETSRADLVVMGNRAFGPIKRMFLGSVSNYVANHAQCPVIIVKGKGTSS
ncbi:hypothetical protein K2173_012486 [Erythroxylum novogranatense]|uniref:UspA domain-containing protein n=1 Tax=Erythroxylum novogranatense TaxID=1862640 RepID=A0AAV8S5G8_9ROSI|nr:hypothetical protein K2173_012486 [Erythroxylum novogranatense]